MWGYFPFTVFPVRCWCQRAPWLQHVQHDATLLECLSCIIYSSSSHSSLPFFSLNLHFLVYYTTRSCPYFCDLVFCVSACVAILSALSNLQEKIKRLELERGHTQLGLHTMGKDAAGTNLQSGKEAQRQNNQMDTDRGISDQSACNQGGCEYKTSVLSYHLSFPIIFMSHSVVRSIDHPPGCCRVSLCEAGAAAGSHEEDVTQCQGRQEQPVQTAGQTHSFLDRNAGH